MNMFFGKPLHTETITVLDEFGTILGILQVEGKQNVSDKLTVMMSNSGKDFDSLSFDDRTDGIDCTVISGTMFLEGGQMEPFEISLTPTTVYSLKPQQYEPQL